MKNNVQPGRSRKHRDWLRLLSFVTTSIFCILLVILTFLKQLALEVLLGYLVINVLTFIIYAWDKSAAKGNRWRIKESWLHLLALIGGWPAAFYAQNVLRHKSIKTSFRRIFLGTVIIHLAVFLVLFTEGQVFYRHLSGFFFRNL